VLGVARQKILLLVSVLIALAFALYLTNIEKHVLEVWCLYCVISQGIIAILALLSIGWVVSSRLRGSTA
jgi:vitamin-K-epoxide reductase (warfarin-sensitive)